MSTSAENIAGGIVRHLEQAWNSADGRAFGEPFMTDADFVDIRGDHHRGQAEIAAGHQSILDSIYKGSNVRYELVQARELADNLILAHVGATLNAPVGPMAGENNALMSIVLMQQGEEWKITSFHNTLVTGR